MWNKNRFHKFLFINKTDTYRKKVEFFLLQIWYYKRYYSYFKRDGLLTEHTSLNKL